jgi:hypothetical protein
MQNHLQKNYNNLNGKRMERFVEEKQKEEKEA